MKTPPNPDDGHTLLDAILTDENWTALDSSLRRQTLDSLRTQRRWRKVRTVSACAAVVAMVMGALLLLRPVGSKFTGGEPVATSVIIRNFKEDELLALFPPGSCVVAEVNGQPRFFILDEKAAAHGFATR